MNWVRFRGKFIHIGSFRVHRWVAAIAVGVVAMILWGIWASHQPPSCHGITVLSARKVDERLTDQGYEVLSHLRGQHGCHYRVAKTPEGLRVVVLYNSTTGRIVISKWDYLEKAKGDPIVIKN